MRTYLILLLSFTLYSGLGAQEEITVAFDLENKKLGDANLPVLWKNRSSIQLKIECLNSAYFATKTTAKPFVFVSDMPDILKPLISSLNLKQGTLKFFENKDEKEKQIPSGSPLYRAAWTAYVYLLYLKTKSDDFYTNTRTVPDRNGAQALIKEVLDDINRLGGSGSSIDDLGLIVQTQLDRIAVAYAAFNKLSTGFTASADATSVREAAEVRAIYQSVSKIDFPRIAASLEQATKAKSHIMTKAFTVEGDGADISLTIFDTYRKDTIYSSKLTFYTYNVFALSFSSGFFGSKSVAPRYYLDTLASATDPAVRDTTKLAVLRDQGDTYDVAIGALAHLSYSTKYGVHPALSIGAALSPFDVKTRYLLGGSLIVGRRRQVVISGGCSWAKLPVLSDFVRTEEGTDRLYVPGSTETVPTVDRWARSGFVGISYNLGRTKKF